MQSDNVLNGSGWEV